IHIPEWTSIKCKLYSKFRKKLIRAIGVHYAPSQTSIWESIMGILTYVFKIVQNEISDSIVSIICCKSSTPCSANHLLDGLSFFKFAISLSLRALAAYLAKAAADSKFK